MPISLVNPAGVFAPATYSQAAVASGSRLILLSGQVALDSQGALVGKGDLAAQAEQAYTNVAVALAGVGASFADVARLTVYVVDWSPEKMEALVGGARRAGAKHGFDVRKAITLIGVTVLASPDFLLEVEAIAVAD
jgi:enamine deaminase RidA (YjgF/YER057c/UK114 family)